MAKDKKAHVDDVIEKLTDLHKQVTDLIQEEKRLKDRSKEIYTDFIDLLSAGSGDILSLQGIFDRDIRNLSGKPPTFEPNSIKYNIEESLQNALLYRQVGMGE